MRPPEPTGEHFPIKATELIAAVLSCLFSRAVDFSNHNGDVIVLLFEDSEESVIVNKLPGAGNVTTRQFWVPLPGLCGEISIAYFAILRLNYSPTA